MLKSKKFVMALLGLIIMTAVLFFHTNTDFQNKALELIAWIIGAFVTANAVEDGAKAISEGLKKK